MQNLERVDAAVMLGDKIVAIWMRGSWYALLNGDYDVVTSADKITAYEGAPRRGFKDEAERAAHRMRMLDALKVIRNINRTRT